LETLLAEDATPADSLLSSSLKDLQFILQPEHLAGQICWIEQRQDGNQFVQSVPEHLAPLLEKNLYSCHATTLLIPPQSAKTLSEILPAHRDTELASPAAGEEQLQLSFSLEETVASVLENPPSGKTVLLMGSRGRIEDVFIRFMAGMEARGDTLICQNLSGGMGRMQAEFAAAKGTAIWALTPWSFEIAELPLESIDHLIIETLPFDHPSHTVLSKRAEHYRNPFTDYTLPRLQHRLYRLLRTFRCYSSTDADVLFLDNRLEKKEYGRSVWHYIRQLAEKKEDAPPAPAQKKSRTQQPKSAPKEGQLPLF
jgi:hypothetical protein